MICLDVRFSSFVRYLICPISHLSNFKDYVSLCPLGIVSEWNNNAFKEPFLDYEKDELIIVTSTGTKKQKWNCQKGWKNSQSADI